jgi:hypothetical protein
MYTLKAQGERMLQDVMYALTNTRGVEDGRKFSVWGVVYYISSPNSWLPLTTRATFIDNCPGIA